MLVKQLSRSDAPTPQTGIVHLGIGAFYRAFGAIYVAQAMRSSGGDWGIVGVSLKSAHTRDALRSQDWAYTSVSLGPDGNRSEVIEVLNDILVAPEDPESVLDVMSCPEVRIVSLTVTEKGYCHHPATGKLDEHHPDIQADLAGEMPVSALGYIVRALARRRGVGIPPFTVLTCDNLPENGRLVRGLVLQLAALIDASLAAWIKDNVRFPSTMVDRITPATTQSDIDQLAAVNGVFDAAPVLHEPFRQWVIEDNFVNDERPDFAMAGAELVSAVTAHEHMKLRMLNGTHSSLAYLGYLGGHETIAEVVADPVYARYVRLLWKEITPVVAAPEGVDLYEYAEALFDRYANPAIRHRTWQIAMDGSQKLPQRILETVATNLEAGRPSDGLCLAIAGWMRFVGGVDENGEAIDVKDPMAARLRNIYEKSAFPDGKVSALLQVREIFPKELAVKLRGPVTSAAESLWNLGAKRAASNIAN